MSSNTRGLAKRRRREGSALSIALECVVVVALALSSSTAWAQTTEEIEARALFEEGVAAGEQADLRRAVTLLSRSYELFEHPGTLVNLGFFQGMAGQAIESYRSHRELVRRFRAVISEEALQSALERLEVLEGSIVRLRLSSEPDGATIAIDGRELSDAELEDEIPLEPGTHRIEALLEGYQTAQETRELTAGELIEISIALEPEAAPLSVVHVSSTTTGAVVVVDDGQTMPLPLQQELEPGEHHLLVEAPGHQPQTHRIDLPVGGEVRLEVALDPVASEDTEQRQERRPFWRSHWPWIIGTVLLLGATGAVLGVTLSGDDETQVDWRLIVR